MTEWMLRAGLTEKESQQVVMQVLNQLPGGFTRAELPVLEQMVKELAVKCHIKTLVEGKTAVESNINYSLNQIGVEYFGGTRWVDALVRVLAAFQHSTIVSEVSRDEFLQKALELLEKIREEQKKDTETSDQEDQASEDSDEGGDYYV